MQAVAPGIQSVSWCVGSDNLTILTNMTCDWSVQTDNAPAPFCRLRWVECTVCHAKWIGVWLIPCGSWRHNHVRSETDIFISESSARSRQLLLLPLWKADSTFEAKKKKSKRHFFCFQLGRRLMYPPSAAIPKCMSVPGPYPRSTTFWCWILCFSSSLWYDLARKPRACRKGLGSIQRGLLDGTYGNYSLIYHLGHGNSCKLGFH